MDQIRRREIGSCAHLYFDNTIVYSKLPKEHAEHINLVFGKLKAASFSLNPSKYHISKVFLKILRYLIVSNFVKFDTEKVSAIQSFGRSINIKKNSVSSLIFVITLGDLFHNMQR
ncbi:hypothetical protein PAEPH01_2275 [Pancytospora epiphaga]|nr:hypothetical protein PAEPH01_2275 [Pancytospora epiphaga]